MHSLPDLPDSTAHEIYARLCRSLPHPIPDTPEARAARADDAMAAVASLYPTDAFMARIAADIVALEAHATDSFDQATHLRADLAGTQRCRAQAISMLRQMRNLWRDYRNVQAERDKAFNEMHPATMSRGGYWFHDVSVPAPVPAAAAPGPDEPAPEAVSPAPAPDADPAPASVAAPAPAEPAIIPFEQRTPAEQYALLYPARAALIRASGGLPPRLTFGPPDPDIVAALVHGTSPILTALDPLALAAE
jgi:hypothetical protein